MNSLLEAAASASAQSAPNSTTGIQQLDDIVKTLKNITNSVGNAGVWLPIVIIVLITLAFLIGFWFNYKWSIFKVVAIVLTMIISAVVYKYGSDLVHSQLKDQKEVDQIIRSGLPFALTVLAMIIYLSLRGFFFVITFIIHLCTINKRKNKKRKRIESGKRGNRIWTRFLFGTTNAILTLPGTLLLSNIVTTAMVNDTSTSKATTFGVKLMTAGKGASLSGIGVGAVSLLELFQKGSKLFETLQNPESKWTKEQFNEIVDTLHSSAALLNNPDVIKVIAQAAKEIATDKASAIAHESGALDYIDKIKRNLREENPLFDTLSAQEQSKQVTDYAIKEIKSIENYENLGVNKDVVAYLNVTKYVISSVSPDTRKALAHILAETLNADKNIKSQINTEAFVNALFDSLSKFTISKNQDKKDVEPESQPTTNTNNSNQPAITSN
ncbi:hypothetical protein ACM0IS_00100 [Mycoplasma aquilae ATCC BAA-1896]|uniref:hypothetical protein n=1 Tax=Mycoplasma aquilae TaxID=1312741 RepID=UPI003A8B786A